MDNHLMVVNWQEREVMMIHVSPSMEINLGLRENQERKKTPEVKRRSFSRSWLKSWSLASKNTRPLDSWLSKRKHSAMMTRERKKE